MLQVDTSHTHTHTSNSSQALQRPQPNNHKADNFNRAERTRTHSTYAKQLALSNSSVAAEIEGGKKVSYLKLAWTEHALA